MAVKRPLSSGCALGLGALTAILPKATCASYYITSHLIGPHDVAMNTACVINNIKLSLRE